MKRIYLSLLLVIICVGILICVEIIRGIYTYHRIKKDRKRQQEEQMYYDALRRENAMLLDLQKQMQQMRECVQRIEEHTKIDNSMTDYKSLQKDSLIISLLNDYEKRAKDNSIRFEQNTESIEEFPCNEMDTVSLLGNLLDNAMEACKNIQCVDYEKIDLFIRFTLKRFVTKDGKTILLEVENSKNPQSKPLENRFATTKENAEEHGRGVAIIKEIVKRYAGEIFFEDKGERFVTRIEFGEEIDDV